MLWRRGELCFSARNQTSPVGSSSPWPIAVPNVTEVKPVTFGVLKVLLQLLCVERRTTVYKFSEESPVCVKRNKLEIWILWTWKRANLWMCSIQDTLAVLYYYETVRSVTASPSQWYLLLRYCPENRIPFYKKNSKHTVWCCAEH